MRTIGLIAGSCEFPVILAKEAQKEGVKIIAFAFPEFTSKKIAEAVETVHWIRFGQLGALINLLHQNGITEIIFAGRIPHQVIFQLDKYEFDQRTIDLVNELVKRYPEEENHQNDNPVPHLIRSRQTNALLTALADEFKKAGICVLDSSMFLKSYLADSGPMTIKVPNSEQMEDINYGYKIAKHIGKMDIGHTVAVKNLTVLAVESIEGTDEVIKRGAHFGGEGMVVVKVCKPYQDLRFDLPIVGPKTIQLMSQKKAAVLAIEAGKTLMLHKGEIIKIADKKGICIYGIGSEKI